MEKTPESPISYDPFCSPVNEAFYEQFPYKTLNTSKKEIRLLKLLPGCGDEAVQCKLLPADPLLSSQPYHALSYYAGDPTKTAVIVVDGIEFNGFTNLVDAMKRLRSKTQAPGWEDTPPLLWADQICINQSDEKERAHQVGLMRDIYYHAARVLVWLGSEEIYSEGIRIMNEIICDIQNQMEAKHGRQGLDVQFQKLHPFGKMQCEVDGGDL